jgi:hypothetical protein
MGIKCRLLIARLLRWMSAGWPQPRTQLDQACSLCVRRTPQQADLIEDFRVTQLSESAALVLVYDILGDRYRLFDEDWMFPWHI